MGKSVKGIAGFAVNPLGSTVGMVSPGLGKAVNPVGYAMQSKIIGRKADGSPEYSSGTSDAPELGAFRSELGADGQFKNSSYNLQNNLNTQGLQAMRAEALRDPATMSKWGQMALTQGRDQNAAQSAGQLSQARNQLAAQGGLRTGARERLAAQSMNSNLQANQAALQNVQMQDEKNRMSYLQALPSQEIAAAQYGSTLEDKNIERQMGEVNAGRDYDKYRYGKLAEIYGANKTSDAMKQAADTQKKTSGVFGGGGFLGLGI